MLSIHNISKSYKGMEVLNVPQLTIAEGESFGLVGNNGAGKTTLFRLCLDLIQPDSGSIRSGKIDVAKSEAWKAYTGSYLDEGFLIEYLTPDEYFYFVGNLYDLSKQEVNTRLERYNLLFDNEIRGSKKYIRDLSKGNQKKVGLAAAMMLDPKMLILDEPFANLDPSSQARLKKIFADIRLNPEITLIISSHELNHVTEVCNRIVVLEKGHIIKDMQNDSHTLRELEEYFAVV
jgi:ABC-2 type transport system ATP-binding protein